MRFKLKIKMLFVLVSILFLVNISTAQEKSKSVSEKKQASQKSPSSNEKSSSASKKSKSSNKKTDKKKSKKKASSNKKSEKKTSSGKSEKSEKKDEKKSTQISGKTDSKDENKTSKTEESAIKNETAPSEKQNLPLPVMKEGDSLPFMQKKSPETPVQETSSSSILTKTLGALFVVLGVLFFGVWGLKKAGIIKPSNQLSENSPELSILSSVSPQNGQTISIVQFGRQTLLVGSTANSFTLLANAGEILTNDNAHLEKLIEKTNDNFDFENKPRSVSDLLAEEDESYIFKEELKKAQNRISNLRNYGGNH